MKLVQALVFVEIPAKILPQGEVVGVIDRGERAIDLVIAHLHHLFGPDLILGELHVLVGILFKNASPHAGVVVRRKGHQVAIALLPGVTFGILDPVIRVIDAEALEVRVDVPGVKDIAAGIGIVDPEAHHALIVLPDGPDHLIEPFLRRRQRILRDEEDELAGAQRGGQIPRPPVAKFGGLYLMQPDLRIPFDRLQRAVDRPGINADDLVFKARLLAENRLKDVIQQFAAVFRGNANGYVHA